jgi:hypothetical protein
LRWRGLLRLLLRSHDRGIWSTWREVVVISVEAEAGELVA